jgi:hypothetical protein
VDLIQLAQDMYGPVVGTCAYHNTLTVTKGKTFLDNLSNYQFLRKDIRLAVVTETQCIHT